MKSKRMIILGVLSLLSVMLLAMVVGAQQVPVTINRVEVEGTDVYPSGWGWNKLDLERDQDIEVKVVLDAWEDADNVEVEAFMSGYEYNDYNRISDTAHVFDVEQGVSYVKKFHLKLSDLVETDEYKLRIIVTDRNGDEVVANYDLKIDLQRHMLKIADIVFYPENEVKSGTALLTTVRLENKGDKDEEDIKVKASIPALGLSASDYIDELESDDEKETEEMYIRLPKCAKAGAYELKVDVEYDNGHEKTGKAMTVNVVDDESCKPAAQPAVTPPAPTVTQTEPSAENKKSSLRSVLEVLLLVLVGLLVIVGLIIGFSKLKSGEEE